MDYIERIKKIKSQKKITNDKLAEMTGIPLGTLSKLLAGINDSPKLCNIVSIAKALDCSLDFLINGTEEQKQELDISSDEILVLEKYRSLDKYGQDLVNTIMDKEVQRMSSSIESDSKKATKILSVPNPQAEKKKASPSQKRSLLLYNLPVSAGVGVYLDDTDTDEISIPDNEKTRSADFALRISGNSMEPKYHDGDIVLVEDTDSVEVGELGIFVMDGNGYFKKFGGDRLISLNSDYGDILLRGYTDIVCCGRVVGKLKRRT